MGELAAQAVAEYEEKWKTPSGGGHQRRRHPSVCHGGRQPDVARAEQPSEQRLQIFAPHTRVYIDIKKEKDTVILSMKNISRDALNIPAEELMERFVRGDSSRHTEGSGLGLNIAQSLVGLQKGTFSLEIEGDLFKAFVAFPATEPPAPPAEELPEEDMPTDAMPMEEMPIEEMQEETEKDE